MSRADQGNAFNAPFFAIGKRWHDLSAMLALHVLVVHWGPAQSIFDTVDLTLNDWGRATAIAASVLLLDEGRKLLRGLFRHNPLTSII